VSCQARFGVRTHDSRFRREALEHRCLVDTEQRCPSMQRRIVIGQCNHFVVHPAAGSRPGTDTVVYPPRGGRAGGARAVRVRRATPRAAL
jgi:hypothetical protein